MDKKLRPWQIEALNRSRKWWLEAKGGKHFLIDAAPGAGKTLASCAIAQTLFEDDAIDRVIVIAPRSEVVNQWSEDFQKITGRFMARVTARDTNVGMNSLDLCVTWAAIQGLLPELQIACQKSRILLICDEHHHAAVEASWGLSAESAFHNAKFCLILTGTPVRSDGTDSVWMIHDNNGEIELPCDATYSLPYGEAVDLGYCRPCTFHRHEGRFSVDAGDGSKIDVSGSETADLAPALKRIPGLQKALDFYKLACTPQYAADEQSPLRTGYQATMLEWGSSKLDELRHRMPNAGGLIIAPSIELAKYMAELIEIIEGETPVIVHSQMPNADQKIKQFKNTDARWLVSVAMVSEGVDIPRLRVLVYLPYALTELAFRQAIGRVVRTTGADDDTRAYVVMPSLETFDLYAKRVENEMPASLRNIHESIPKTKKCRVCHAECPLNAKTCHECETEFPASPDRLKKCHKCGESNDLKAEVCVVCGESFSTEFQLSLNEALRIGAIVRGMEIDEDEVKAGEKIAASIRREVLKSGDENLVNIIKKLPEESWGRLQSIMGQTG
jgi:superfamily II DNA or RNA helicase